MATGCSLTTGEATASGRRRQVGEREGGGGPQGSQSRGSSTALRSPHPRPLSRSTGRGGKAAALGRNAAKPLSSKPSPPSPLPEYRARGGKPSPPAPLATQGALRDPGL